MIQGVSAGCRADLKRSPLIHTLQSAMRVARRLGLALLIVLIAVVVLRTMAVRPPAAPELLEAVLPDGREGSADRLSALIRVPTVSKDDQPADSVSFARLHLEMARLWPGVHSELAQERHGVHSLLYRWDGRRADLAPIVLMAHLDVVPADTADAWAAPPFSGEQRDGMVWGRGALDDKGALTAILDAVESLLEQSFQPPRTVYLAFGHDEEVGGTKGAGVIVDALKARDVVPAFVLDEGGFPTHGAIPGVSGPVAVVGVAEKGSMSVRLTATGAGGHSSVPPESMAVTNLAEALLELKGTPFQARIDGATEGLFEAVAHAMPIHLRALFANRWLTEPLLIRVLAGKPTTNATIRTSMAFTMLAAGTKPNVLPDRAEAVVNFRLLPGDTVEEVVSHVERAVAGRDILVELLNGSEAVGPAPTGNAAFRYVSAAIRASHPAEDLIVAPYMASGGTDGKHFAELTENVYRYIPFDLYPTRDGVLLHGVNERVEATQMVQAVRFYATLIGSLEHFEVEGS